MGCAPVRGQHKEHRLPNQVFVVEYRLSDDDQRFLAVRVTIIQAIMILASPPTGLLKTTVLYDVGIAT